MLKSSNNISQTSLISEFNKNASNISILSDMCAKVHIHLKCMCTLNIVYTLHNIK